MKYDPDNPRGPIVELSRRNLETLLEKLDDPHSLRTLVSPDVGPDDARWIRVEAVEDEAHYADRAPGVVYTNGEYK